MTQLHLHYQPLELILVQRESNYPQKGEVQFQALN